MKIWFENPQWLVLLLAVPVVVGLPLLVRSLAGLSGPRRIVALILRSSVMILLTLCLAGVHWTETSKSVSVVYVVDTSDSVPAELQRAAERFVHRSKQRMRQDDRAGLISFDGTAEIEQVPMKGRDYTSPLSPADHPEQTNLAGALRLAAAVFPPDSAKRIVILSDGNETAGDAAAEARRLAAADVGIDVVPLTYSYAHEVQIKNLWAPATARVGDEIPLKITIDSRSYAEGELILTDNGVPIDLDPASPGTSLRVKLRPGKNALLHRIRVDAGGVHRFALEFRPASDADDTLSQNNRASAFTTVAGQGKVLVLSTSWEDDEKFVQALKDSNISVDVVPAESMPTELADYQPYAAVVLSNVPAELVAKPVQEALAAYVKDLGGGLIMLGGDSSFGAGGWIGSPVEKVMPVSFEVKAKRQVPRGALVLIMHSSEMARGNYWGKVIAQAAVDAITSLDYVGVIAYQGMTGADWVVPLQLATNKAAIKRAIGKMFMGDMPDFDTGLIKAIYALNGTDAAQKHIIIISDGDPSPASSGVISQLQNSRITVTTVAIGMGMHVFPGSLRALQRATNGRFYMPSNPNALPKIFVKEARTISRALIYEKPFRVRLRFSSGPVAGLAEGGIPILEGMVLTTPKPLIEMPMVSEKGDPLLAYWQIGLGRAVAFTSGMWRRWGPQWLGWERFSPLWAQVVRWAMRKSGPTELDIQTVIEEGKGKLVIEAVDKTAGYINFLEFRGRLIDPEMQAKELQIVQTGPGRYEAQFEADAPGAYVISLAYRKGGEAGWGGVQTAGIATSYSAEYARLEANPAMLEKLAEIGGGKVLPLDPQQADVFRRDLPEAVRRVPAWPQLLALAMALFLLDVAVRRIAIEPQAVLRAVRGWLADLAGRWRGAAERAESLEALKQKRQELQEQWRQRLERTAPVAQRETVRQRKFEAAREGPGDRDALETLAAAREPDAPTASRPGESPDQRADATSRLLRAKRRARQRMDAESERDAE